MNRRTLFKNAALLAAAGRLAGAGALDPGHPYGGGIRQCAFLLPNGYAGVVYLSAQIEMRPGVSKPVAWACEQVLNPDGSIAVEVKRPDDSSWRKGI